MPELGGLRYEPVLHHRWGKPAEAFHMEQELLRRFDARRHPRNREIVAGVSFEDLSTAWAAALSETRRARR